MKNKNISLSKMGEKNPMFGKHHVKETKRKISETLKKKALLRPDYSYVCEKCNEQFDRRYKIRDGRRIHCDNCKRKVVHRKNPDTILELSKRTVSKIMRRANKECSICLWKEEICDIHHIVPKSKGGTDDMSNLIILCPNCHRVVANTDKYNNDFLYEFTIDKTFIDWKKHYLK